MKQVGIFDDVFVDSFAGGGGASTGIELATGHPVDIAINHDESAIMMHKRNHPFTEHYREDIWQVDPVNVVRGRHVRLAWFSPDCKHFSRAKGSALVDKHIRGLAWVVLRWAAKVRPDVIMLENVPEFVTWGPVRKGKPVKSKSGQTYRKWRSQLEALGYHIETKQLCAADYGAPTIRTRFCLVARCDGQPIVFPERTHAPRDSEEVKSGKLKPWRSAAEIIDWSLPCYSIFESKEQIKEQYGVRVVRPLKENTLKRIARGLDKFVLKCKEPFIIQTKFDNPPQDISKPLGTVTAVGSHSVVDPLLSPYYTELKYSTGKALDPTEPLHTVTSRDSFGVVAPTLIQYHSEQSDREVRGNRVDEPLRTADGSNRYGMVCGKIVPYIMSNNAENVPHGLDEPVPTITTANRNYYTAAYLSHFKGQDKGQDCRDPLMTVTARDGQFGEVTVKVVRAEQGQNLGYWGEIRKMLNTYCGYCLAEDEILLLNISGTWYFISDIGLRMLSPRELYDAMGFPHDYIIDKDKDGNQISRADQVARCGNAVCPPIAEAMVRANLPECHKDKINSMEELRQEMVS